MRMRGAGALLLLVAMSCGGSGSPAQEPRSNDPCAPGGSLRPRPRAVATTRTPSGQIVDWISIESQTPDGKIAAPPPPPPSPPSPPSPSPSPSPSPVGVSQPADGLGTRGPPGTVPMIRPPHPLCDCHPGYLPRPGGSCAPEASVCVGEGGMASGKAYTFCCEGLTRSSIIERVDGVCVDRTIDALLCTRCGDRACGPGESDCNCPSDCR